MNKSDLNLNTIITGFIYFVFLTKFIDRLVVTILEVFAHHMNVGSFFELGKKCFYNCSRTVFAKMGSVRIDESVLAVRVFAHPIFTQDVMRV